MDATRPGYRQVAASLREQIISGEFRPGDALPGQTQLAKKMDADVAVVNRAVSLLEQEGFVEVGHGRRTVVRARRRYRAIVKVPSAGDHSPGEQQHMTAALAAAAGAEPSASDPALAMTPDHALFSLIVEAADEARAAMVAYRLARAVCGDTWNVTAASGAQEPADSP